MDKVKIIGEEVPVLELIGGYCHFLYESYGI